MTDVLEKCSVCHALVDEEDLFCANCGTEAPDRTKNPPPTRTSTVNFTCSGCGAAMSYDASAQTLRCPFCGSEKLEQDKDAKVLSPKFVVPFAVPKEQALGILRSWLGRGIWRPGDLATAAVVTKLTAVYVPYWVFAARTYTFWTADTSRTPPGARAAWYPISGEHHGAYSGLLIGASSALTPAETSAICPFDLAQGVPPEQVDLDNIVVENFRVQRKYARPLAQAGLESLERQACQQYVPGNARNIKVNVRMEGLTSEPALVPVWIMAYQYRDHLYRFLLNGQSGRCTGQAPVSWRKILLVIGVVLLVIVGILACLGVFGAISAALEGNRHRAPLTPEKNDLDPLGRKPYLPPHRQGHVALFRAWGAETASRSGKRRGFPFDTGFARMCLHLERARASLRTASCFSWHGGRRAACELARGQAQGRRPRQGSCDCPTDQSLPEPLGVLCPPGTRCFRGPFFCAGLHSVSVFPVPLSMSILNPASRDDASRSTRPQDKMSAESARRACRAASCAASW